MNAWRFQEAHAAAKQWTAEAKNDAGAWLMRGYAAVESGDAKDAVAAFGRALAIDPTAQVPDYVRKKE